MTITKLDLCDLFISVPLLPLYLPAFCLELLSSSTISSSLVPSPPAFHRDFLTHALLVGDVNPNRLQHPTLTLAMTSNSPAYSNKVT